jgi:N-acetylmuramoyl-L-alanine amidase
LKISKEINIKFLVIILFFSLNIISQSSRNFVIILDAGHGGKDPGNSYNGFVEKDIALKTTLKVEKYLQRDRDIQVIYTRKKDVFIELRERPKVANNIDANLFISIHCNSVSNSAPYGTETFVMGLARSNTNFEIAKKENSVILLEKNYKKSYRGFDPNKPETLIGLKIMQEEYLNRSISLASKIEKNFTSKLNRKSRGIKQTPLWVLDAAYMPSVLIELGFLSNKEEGLYLNSESGQDKMAETIADAIISYKRQYFENDSDEPALERSTKNQRKDTATILKNKTSKETVSAQKKTVDKESSGVVFKVQIATSKKSIKLVPINFKGLKNVSLSTDNGNFFKYNYSSTSDYAKAKQNLEIAKSKGFPSAYLVAFKNGEKISIQEAVK